MTIFDQLIELEFEMIKAIMADKYSWVLKQDLSELPALPDGFLLGEVVIEVLKLRLRRIELSVAEAKANRGEL